MENVRGMFSAKNGAIFKPVVRAIVAMGYQVTFYVIDIYINWTV